MLPGWGRWEITPLNHYTTGFHTTTSDRVSKVLKIGPRGRLGKKRKKHGLQRLQRNKISYQQTHLLNRSSLSSGGLKTLYISRRRRRLEIDESGERGGCVYVCDRRRLVHRLLTTSTITSQQQKAAAEAQWQGRTGRQQRQISTQSNFVITTSKYGR